MDTFLWKKRRRRSAIRIRLGTVIYTARRWLRWQLDTRPQASRHGEDLFPHLVFSHETPLYRKLDGMDSSLVNGKIINLRLACACLDGLVLRPGENLSYWRQIGNPSRRRGFQNGLILVQGKPTVGIGGGLCQLSNLLYWMTLHAPLTVTERWRHSYDVFPDSGRTLPFGSGATCVYNYRDLCLENHSSESFQLRLRVTDQYLYGEWRSDFAPQVRFEVYEKSHWFSQAPNGAYLRNNVLHRQSIRNGLVESDVFLTENHALMMYPPFLAESHQSE